MFLSTENYLDQLKRVIADSQNLRIAVAFWGNGAEKLFEGWQGKSAQVICNLASGGTNPEAIRGLMAVPGVEVRNLGNLHAKVVLSETQALIGSANLSANGLGYESAECEGWQEAGVQTSDPSQLAAAQSWFEKLWDAAGASVTPAELKQAERRWARRRATRLPIAQAKGLIDLPYSEVADRPIYMAIYRDQASQKAQEVCEEVREELQRAPGASVDRGDIDFFEDWPDSCDEPLPKNAPLIMVRYGKRGGVAVQNIWKRFERKDSGYTCPEEGWVSVQILLRQEDACGWKLPPKDQQALAQRLKRWLPVLEQQGAFDEGARCIPFQELLRWEAEHPVNGSEGG